MARIRTIKPEFPQSETIGNLSRDARLLFIQLWTIVDDSGRARASSRLLASLLYPYDNDAPKLMNGWLEELEQNGCIRRYEVDGSSFLDIPKWLTHQKIDKPSASRLPEYSGIPREPSRTLATDLGPVPRTLDQDLVSAPRARVNDWPKDFEERFWSLYPLRIAKQQAIKALRRIHSGDGVSWGVLEAAVKIYAASVSGKEPKFIKHPATWLNGGCWDDELPGETRIFAASSQTQVAGETFVAGVSLLWEPLAKRWRAEHGKSTGPPQNKEGGWRFPSEWLSDLNAQKEAAE